MLRTAVHYLRLAISFTVGWTIASVLLLRILVTFIKFPISFITGTFWKKKGSMPPCLNDPALGSHGFIHLTDVKLHYVASGDESKPLMLFLHGFPEFWYSWRFQIREFKKDYRVVAVDMRGYGDSDSPGGINSYTIDKLADDIRQLIPALGKRSCVLVSHDWGGLIAWHFTMRNPSMVDKLIVMNCPHPAAFRKHLQTSWKQIKKSWYVMFFQTPFIPELLFTHCNSILFKDVYKQVERTGNMSKSDVAAYMHTFTRPGDLTGPINYYRAAMRNDGRTAPKVTISCPSLLIWGLPDLYLDEKAAELSRKYVDNLDVKYIKDSNHFVQMSSPETVNRLMREFLR